MIKKLVKQQKFLNVFNIKFLIIYMFLLSENMTQFELLQIYEILTYLLCKLVISISNIIS